MITTRCRGVLVANSGNLVWNLKIQEEVELEVTLHCRKGKLPGRQDLTSEALICLVLSGILNQVNAQ